jgi:ABC-2 type transport system permease protein
MLSNTLTIARRESAAYFNSAIAYIFATVFVLLNGGLYMTQFFLAGRADMRPFFMLMPFLLAVFIPAVSMRLWAEERRGNTLEMLLTFPMRTGELVLGKFLAALGFYLAALASTLTLPVMLAVLGRPDLGAIAGGYIGAVLIGAFFLAIGLFVSGFLRDQITAFILGMLICFTLYFAGTDFVAASIDGWLPGFGTLIRLFAGAARHFDAFAKGVVDIRDVLYFVLGTGLFLWLNAFWLDGRMRPKAASLFVGAIAIAAGVFFAGNGFFAGFNLGRFDLTDGRIYTVSETSKQIFKNLKSPVMVKYYVSSSEKMPAGMKTLEADVVGKLEEFRLAGGGKFQYKILHMDAVNAVQADPAGGSSQENELAQKGIQPFQVQSIEADEVGVKLVYSSITIAYKEKPEEVLPRVMPENLDDFEYGLVSKVYRLTLAATPRVALVAPYQERNLDP